MLADHLRVRLELGIEREQRVEHHIAVVARDISGRPDRVENAQIRTCDKAQRRPASPRRPHAETQRRGGAAHRHGGREFAARQADQGSTRRSCGAGEFQSLQRAPGDGRLWV